MIQFFYKFQNSVFASIITGLVVLSMFGFGLNLFAPSVNDYAIKVGDKEISQRQYFERRARLESNYRRMFGENFEKMRGYIEPTLTGTSIDSLITDRLLLDFSEDLNLKVGNPEVVDFIKENIFGTGFKESTYKNFLESRGMTAEEFQESIRDDLQVDLVKKLIQVYSKPSRMQVLAKALNNSAEVNATIYEFDPKEYVTEAADSIKESDFEEFYEDKREGFRISEQVTFDYTYIDEKTFPNLIVINDDDIESYYAEHKEDFKTKLKYRYNSYYIETSTLKDEEKKGFDEAVNSLEPSKISNLGETVANLIKDKKLPLREMKDEVIYFSDKKTPFMTKMEETYDKKGKYFWVSDKLGIMFSEVLGREESRQLSIEESKEQIKAAIIKEDTPSYLGEKVSGIYEEIQDGKWEEVLASYDLKSASAGPVDNQFFLEAERSLGSTQPEVVTTLIKNPDTKYHQINVGPSNYYIVRLNNLEESYIPKLEAVKDKIKPQLIDQKARELAMTQAKNVNKAPDKSKKDASVEQAENNKVDAPTESTSKESLGKLVLIKGRSAKPSLVDETKDGTAQELGYSIPALVNQIYDNLNEKFQVGEANGKIYAAKIHQVKYKKIEDLVKAAGANDSEKSNKKDGDSMNKAAPQAPKTDDEVNLDTLASEVWRGEQDRIAQELRNWLQTGINIDINPKIRQG